jgi:hypothetical protein
LTVEADASDAVQVAHAFKTIRESIGDPEVGEKRVLRETRATRTRE